MGLLQEYENQYSILTAEITSNIGKLKVSALGKYASDLRGFYYKPCYAINFRRQTKPDCGHKQRTG